jgi:hypothetical protein
VRAILKKSVNLPFGLAEGKGYRAGAAAARPGGRAKSIKK